jgi:hypothetical protein
MEPEKIGLREFRENLAGYLESGRPLAITRHGETLGFYIPSQKRSRKAEVEAMRAAAKELDVMIATRGISFLHSSSPVPGVADRLPRVHRRIRIAGYGFDLAAEPTDSRWYDHHRCSLAANLDRATLRFTA